MLDIMPKVKDRVTGAVDNTRGTIENIMNRVKTGKPNIIDIPQQHVSKFAEMNRRLVGK